MTCIAGLVDDDGCLHMGADSASTSGWDLRLTRNSKIFRVHGTSGDMLMGVSGSPRMSQLLKYHLILPGHPQDLPVDAYIVTLAIPAMRALFKEAGYAQKEREQEMTDSSLLIGYRGRLIVISSNYQINERESPYEAIGSGSSFALGVLYATAHLAPQQRVKMAMEAAESLSAGVRGPFTYETLEPYAEPSLQSTSATQKPRKSTRKTAP